ncbi:hypothetical protein ACIQGO_02790 [Streptomyces shenzhenensis]
MSTADGPAAAPAVVDAVAAEPAPARLPPAARPGRQAAVREESARNA